MKTYKQKSLESHTLSSPKRNTSDPVQFMRIRLNDDVSQNLHFDQLLRQVRTSKDEVIKQLPSFERKKYTPHVVGEEIQTEEGDIVLEDNEDIVFEGHGRGGIFSKRNMEGHNADQLAEIARNVVGRYGNTLLWRGRVVLLGCQTAPIVIPLAERLKKMFCREINVVGTKKDIFDTLGTEPYVYYKGDESKTPINFTNSAQVEMAYPELFETQGEDKYTILSWKLDEMGISKSIPPPAPLLEIADALEEGWDSVSRPSATVHGEDQ